MLAAGWVEVVGPNSVPVGFCPPKIPVDCVGWLNRLVVVVVAVGNAGAAVVAARKL